MRLSALAVLGLCLAFAPTGGCASSLGNAIVTKATVYPGQRLTAGDLTVVALVKAPTIRYRFVSELDQVVGLVATRTLLPGRFIPLKSLRMAPVLKAGRRTRMELRSKGLAIGVTVVALSDLSSGQRGQFRNPASGKILTGVVRADGSVTADVN